MKRADEPSIVTMNCNPAERQWVDGLLTFRGCLASHHSIRSYAQLTGTAGELPDLLIIGGTLPITGRYYPDLLRISELGGVRLAMLPPRPGTAGCPMSLAAQAGEDGRLDALWRELSYAQAACAMRAETWRWADAPPPVDAARLGALVQTLQPPGTLLLVGAETWLVEPYLAVLEEESFQCLRASGAADCLEQLDAAAGMIDVVVVMQRILPDLLGLELCEHVKRRTRALPTGVAMCDTDPGISAGAKSVDLFLGILGPDRLVTGLSSLVRDRRLRLEALRLGRS